MKLTAQIDVFAGAFASQQLAFAHLLDRAAVDGLSPDFDHVEVIRPPHLPRLGGYFPESAATLSAEAGADTLILVLPGALVTGRFAPDGRLRSLGRHCGLITRAMVP